MSKSGSNLNPLQNWKQKSAIHVHFEFELGKIPIETEFKFALTYFLNPKTSKSNSVQLPLRFEVGLLFQP